MSYVNTNEFPQGGRGRGASSRDSRPQRDNRTNKNDIARTNEKFEHYYNELNVVPQEEREQFWEAMRRDLPNSFRFTGSRSHALAVQERLRNFYIPEITSIKHEGDFVEPPKPVDWYPDQLAWYMTTPKNVIRRFKPFASFQKFLVTESDVGNITRQEVVSMIPPLVIDIKPGMTVLDLCAAPGSKSSQLLEMIHDGEEDRAREVASHVSQGTERPQGEDYVDDGRSTGLLIANDVDYKRAHMLVHQMKRLASPNIIVTNHDATIYPSIKIPSEPPVDGKPSQNRYLKFDRILADVPCSGDGTPRKNIEVWRTWTPSNGLGLHMTQVRILVRALQMLKVGGRVVYSTCSMNPVEDEAVLSAAIDRCGGPQVVSIEETKDLLPGLRRSPGLKEWKIMDKQGRIWSDWASIEKQRADFGEDGLGRLAETMFPSSHQLPLDRAMRVYPHQQDTGAFFIAILEKKSEIRARPEEKGISNVKTGTTKVSTADTNGDHVKMEIEDGGETTSVEAVQNGSVEINKRKREENDDENDVKRIKNEDISETNTDKPIAKPAISEATQPRPNQNFQSVKKNRDQPFEEPFKYLDSEIPELQQIYDFYKIAPQFPQTRFMVRNAQSTATKNIYYTTELAKAILQENEGKGMKFVHSGVKMFVKQDAPSPEVCPWRIQTDGLRILETWVGRERVVKLQRRETFQKLLIEMFPRFHGDDWKNLGEVGEQVRDIGMGCCVLIVEPTEDEGGFSERMVFPLWKSVQSLNLMLPKEERKALLLRLFNDDTELKNPMGNKSKQGEKAEKVELQIEEPRDSEEAVETAPNAAARRNSSSMEPEPAAARVIQQSNGTLSEGDDDEDGGVLIDGS